MENDIVELAIGNHINLSQLLYDYRDVVFECETAIVAGFYSGQVTNIINFEIISVQQNITVILPNPMGVLKEPNGFTVCKIRRI